MTAHRLWAVGIVALAFASPARAGPPYVTDDPEPTDTGHIEDYAYVSGASARGQIAGETGIELNYGAARDWQVSATIPFEFVAGHDGTTERGDLQLAAKYRFLHQSDGSWMPDAAFFPAVSLPTGAGAFNSGHATLFLPVWVQKDIGKWSSFAGGGYDINPGTGRRDFTLLGWAVTRQVSERLNLGVEIYHQTPSAIGGALSTDLAFGAIYQLTKHLALLSSGGPDLQHTRQNGNSTFYVSLLLTD